MNELKNTFAMYWLALCLVLLPSCSRSAKQDPKEAPVPTATGDEISFAPGAPQLSYLSIEPARERKELATGLTGRLAWNDDVTARVFPPVSGRTIEIQANPGQEIKAGTVLAKIKSPD